MESYYQASRCRDKCVTALAGDFGLNASVVADVTKKNDFHSHLKMQ